MYTGNLDRLNHQELVWDYRKGKLDWMNSLVWRRYYLLEEEICKKESYLRDEGLDISVESDLERLRVEQEKVINRIHLLGVDVSKLDEKEKDRRSREKVADTVSLTLPDIHRIMGAKVIEIDGDDNL